jgi:phosphate:Na+ symporter
VILLTTFASRGLITPELAVVMVLGVNLGSSVIAPVLTRHAPPENRVVPCGNLLMRGAGSLIMLVLFETFHPPVAFLGSDAVSQVVNAHILFNFIVLTGGIPLSGPVLRIAGALVSRSAGSGAQPSPLPAEIEQYSALDMTVLALPSQALANATREVVGVCETIETMLRRIIGLYERPDQARIDELESFDDRVDKQHAAIKLYLTRLAVNPLSDFESQRMQELLGACIKLEQVGDIIVRNMLVQVQKKMDHKLQFTEAHMAFNVIVSRDGQMARQLIEEKDRLRELEKQTSLRHFNRLREGAARSIETSTIHLDTIRDLKQINSLLASMAYPVLEEQGLLSDTRLKVAKLT